MLNINISFFKNPNTVTSDCHFLGRLKVNFNDDGPVHLLLDARGRVFTADPARLVEHVRRDFALVGADKYLEGGGLVVARQLDDGEAVAGAVLDGAPAALGLVARPVLRLGLAHHLQLHAAVAAGVAERGGEGDGPDGQRVLRVRLRVALVVVAVLRRAAPAQPGQRGERREGDSVHQARGPRHRPAHHAGVDAQPRTTARGAQQRLGHQPARVRGTLHAHYVLAEVVAGVIRLGPDVQAAALQIGLLVVPVLLFEVRQVLANIEVVVEVLVEAEARVARVVARVHAGA